MAILLLLVWLMSFGLLAFPRAPRWLRLASGLASGGIALRGFLRSVHAPVDLAHPDFGSVFALYICAAAAATVAALLVAVALGLGRDAIGLTVGVVTALASFGGLMAYAVPSYP